MIELVCFSKLCKRATMHFKGPYKGQKGGGFFLQERRRFRCLKLVLGRTRTFVTGLSKSLFKCSYCSCRGNRGRKVSDRQWTSVTAVFQVFGWYSYTWEHC
ncbi:hypothetical protein Gasu2_28300 [Galdieria sulphuraria]|nr:hypothetical protein Gasu2_28300 [Galdieria sulphuraria]